MTKLSKKFYVRDTVTVARDLIGCYLVRNTKKGPLVGRICETEAYHGGMDKACHAYPNKRTKRTMPLFEEGGISYVYFIYGMYYCFNVVTEKKGIPCAVLIRGIDIVEGLDEAVMNRYGKSVSEISRLQMKNLSNGPGKLCKALDITKELNTESLLGENLFICDRFGTHIKQVDSICQTKRIGIDYAQEAKEFLWRFIG